MKREQIEIGEIDIPIDYMELSDRMKKSVCNKIIDQLLIYIEDKLDPTINRINFLDEVFESSIETNEMIEKYEVCSVFRDCRKLLNE
jgi:hypothetical protein